MQLLTRFVLENPWPLAIALTAIAAAFAWTALRDGRRRPLQIAGALALVAAIVLALGLSITTPAEHGEVVTRQLVASAVAGDVNAALALFTPNAAFTIGSPTNPGFDLAFVEARLESLPDRIRENYITTLKGTTESPDIAVIELACRTATDYGGLTPSQWLLRIERQPDERWLITRLTAVSINGQPPPDRLW